MNSSKYFLAIVCVTSLFAALPARAAFKVTSSTVKAGHAFANDQVFNSFGCSGKNVSPELKWQGEPKGTKAFAVTMFDPDAPTGSGWWHWVLVNIPADVHELALGAGAADGSKLPKGALQSNTDFGQPGYGGPCPPPGKPHRYILTVYALKGTVPLDAKAPGAMAGFYLNQMKLAEAKLAAKYGR